MCPPFTTQGIAQAGTSLAPCHLLYTCMITSFTHIFNFAVDVTPPDGEEVLLLLILSVLMNTQ